MHKFLETQLIKTDSRRNKNSDSPKPLNIINQVAKIFLHRKHQVQMISNVQKTDTTIYTNSSNRVQKIGNTPQLVLRNQYNLITQTRTTSPCAQMQKLKRNSRKIYPTKYLKS